MKTNSAFRVLSLFLLCGFAGTALAAAQNFGQGAAAGVPGALNQNNILAQQQANAAQNAVAATRAQIAQKQLEVTKRQAVRAQHVAEIQLLPKQLLAQAAQHPTLPDAASHLTTGLLGTLVYPATDKNNAGKNMLDGLADPKVPPLIAQTLKTTTAGMIADAATVMGKSKTAPPEKFLAARNFEYRRLASMGMDAAQLNKTEELVEVGVHLCDFPKAVEPTAPNQPVAEAKGPHEGTAAPEEVIK